MAVLPNRKFLTKEKKRSLFKLGSLLIIGLIGLMLVLIVPKSTPNLASRNATMRVFTFDGWDVNQTDADLQYIAAHYDVLITDGYSYYNNKVGYLHQQNPALKVLPYINALVVVKNEDDWTYINANHPDWFLKDASGNRVYEKYFTNNFLLDPNNAGWKAYRAQRLYAYTVTYGYDGVYLDVINPWINDGYGYVYYSAQPVNPATGALFTNTEWKQANLGFLDSMKQAIGPTKTLMINGLLNGDTYFRWGVADYMVKADSALMEGFLRWGQEAVSFNKPESEWKKDIDAVNEVAQTGKEAVALTAVYDEVGATATELRAIHMYSLSSYLLASGSTTGYCFKPPSTTSVQPYDDLWATSIGQPVAAYYKLNNVYQRDFTDGKALVNPTDTGQTFNVALGGSYRTFDGQVITSISLPPKTGTILTKIVGAVPSVSFKSLIEGATVRGKVSLPANASDDVGVTKVEFYIDGELDSTDTAAPYEATWYTTYYTKGNHTITAKAYDDIGNIGTATITVSVDSQVTVPPANNDVLVKFKTGTSQPAVSTIIQRFGLTTKKILLTNWYQFTVPAGTSVAHMTSLLLNEPEVEFAEINFKRGTGGDEVPVAVSAGENASASNDQMVALDLAGLPVVTPLPRNSVPALDANPTGVAGAQTITNSTTDIPGGTQQNVNNIATYGLYTVLSLFVLAVSALTWRILFA
jgi:hypothetical protein